MAKATEFPKTNAMRRLDSAKIRYEIKTYVVDENDLSGIHIAEQIAIPYEQCFKTLVANGDKTGPLVFCIPVKEEIDLKHAAAITKNKKIEMIHVISFIREFPARRTNRKAQGGGRKFPVPCNTSVRNG